jgi:glycosyltransferase involved in cell wall biosynthesis
MKAGLTKNTNKLSKVTCPAQDLCKEYAALLIYYKKLFELVDCFHFNSAVSKKTYERYLLSKQSIVLPISHTGIKDARKLKKCNKAHIRLAFIGSIAAYKGFPMLKEVLRNLLHNGLPNWTLQVWGANIGIDAECDKIIYKGKYSPDDLESVFSAIDLLIVPSVCKETFSIITLEALSFGVPVLVSNNVGAKDMVEKYNTDFVFRPSEEFLYSKLQDILINPVLLEDYNKKICANKFEYLIDDHAQKLNELYMNKLA